MRYLGAAALLLVMSSFAGCDRGESSGRTLTPASRSTPSAERAAEDVTRARCDRAERCGDIGLEATYLSRQHCLNVLWDDSMDELRSCRSGVDQVAVQDCLAEIGSHGCSDAVGSFQQYLACKVEDLCQD
jgi:hypothetical protein